MVGRTTPEQRKSGKVGRESVDDLIALFLARHPDGDADLIRLAYEFGEQAHQGQVRINGEPVFTHPVATAVRLAKLGLDETTIAAALLHDVTEDAGVSAENLRREFGKDIAFLVDGVTKLGHIKYRGLERYVENVRRMFIAMAADVRVILIKLSDRIHNLATLGALPEAKRLRIARESLDIYAPIANRLGIGELKGEIEDLAFRYVDPDAFRKLEAQLQEYYPHAERVLRAAQQTIRRRFADEQIPIINCHGRKKHLYSLWRKLQRPEVNGNLESVHDLAALRIVVPNVASCYQALGVIHQLWRPLKGRIKDYIAQPKPNGYRSLHTTVFGPHGRIMEIQIRDVRMHDEAEFGIVAHWHYAESGKPRSGARLPQEMLAWTQELTKWKREFEHDHRYLEALKIEVFQNQIFVFTPRGDVVELPEEATPIDFAYRIHSDLGNRCTGARVNDRLVPLESQLKSGDVVEILTEKRRRKPNSDWLEVVKTSAAREAIRRSLRR